MTNTLTKLPFSSKTKRLKKLKRKLRPLKSRLHDTAWDLMSKLVRLEHADWRGYVRCYTCPEISPYKEMHAGHFKHSKQDFNKKNIKPQCVSCNKWHSGRLDIYAEHLVREYGPGILKELTLAANTEKVMSSLELKALILDLKSQLKKYA